MGPRRKSDHFLNNISQTKNSVYGIFSLFNASKGGGGEQKAVKTCVYEGKG
jgi:hypothetical protein